MILVRSRYALGMISVRSRYDLNTLGNSDPGDVQFLAAIASELIGRPPGEVEHFQLATSTNEQSLIADD